MVVLHRFRAYFVYAIPPLSHGLFALFPLLWWAALTDGEATWPLIIGAFVVGNLPDVDTGSSRIGRLVPPLSRFLERRFGHRTITHSLLAVIIIGLITWLPITLTNAQLFSPWWWWPTFYALHLLFDLIVGGAAGLPLFWPWRRRVWLEIDVRPGSTAERVIFVILIVACLLPFAVQLQDLSPNRIIRAATGSVEIALADARSWESRYVVWVEIEGTEQESRNPVNGRFRVNRITGTTFHLNDEQGNEFTAGQGQEDVYLLRAVAVQGEIRPFATLPPPPTITPTPHLVTIQIANVFSLDEEILVQVGDEVEQGQLLADLQTYRFLNPLLPTGTAVFSPTPPPSSTPTRAEIPPTSTPYPTPDPLHLAELENRRDLARARYRAIVATGTPDPNMIAAVPAYDLAIAEKVACVNANEPGHWRYELCLKELHELEATAQALQATAVPLDPLTADIAYHQLQAAEIEYQQALAWLTPPATVVPTLTPTPTHRPTDLPTTEYQPTNPPTATATLPAGDDTRVRSLVAGQVIAIDVVRVAGNAATVEIVVWVGASATDVVPTVVAAATTIGVPEGMLAAEVVRVSDGDTAVFVVNGIEESVRFIGVDTPETVHPDKPVECYGPEASDFTKSMLPAGTAVFLELDDEPRDRYGRMLAYVWLPDGRMINELLVENGYGDVLTIRPNDRYADRFRQAQGQARTAKRGLWGNCQ